MYGKKNYYRRKFRLAKILFFVLIAAALLGVMSAVVMWLWNAILPPVTGVGTLNYWQAMGLLILFRILSGGFRFRGFRSRRNTTRRWQWREKWMNMSEEERAEFKAKWKERCGRKP